MKKKLSFLLSTLLILTMLPSTAFAKENGENRLYLNPMSESERAEERLAEIKEQVSGLIADDGEYAIRIGDGSIIPLNDIDDYKTETSPTKMASVSGYAGNQVPGGYRFPSGGGFYYSEGGGPKISVSVGFSIPYGIHSFSFGLGIASDKGSSGVVIDVPDKEHFFKLHITKNYEVQAYIIYKKIYPDDSGQYEWTEWSGGRTSTLYTIEYDCKQMN